ncbi:MAG: ABC transporter substrate-binding protein [Clostridia bacterium]
MRARIKRRLALFAVMALVAALLSGCGTQKSTITIVSPSAQPAEYAQAGYYAPDAQPVYEGEIIPAPGDVADWSAEMAQDAANAEYGAEGGAESGATPNHVTLDTHAGGSMTTGDMTYGVVVGMDAAINPLQTIYRDLYAVNQLVFESLVELDQNMQPVPLLADKWEVSGNTWVFTLRSGIPFHNGAALTAYDVVASYQEILLNPANRYWDVVQPISDMQAEDDLTLRVTSKGAGYMLLYAMTFPVAQQSTVQDQLPVGTGPYLYASYNPAISLRLEANPMWWKRASGYIRSVEVVCYRTTKAALVGLELGEIDALATDYPTAALNRSLSDRMTRDYSTQTYECIVPNLKSRILEDINVRRALMYAIDRTTVCETAYAGMAQESEVPVIPGSWLYDPQATKFNYSPERALQLLYDAGWADADQNGVLEKNIDGVLTSLSLKLYTYDRGTTANRSEAAALIAKQLRMVGFDVTVETGLQSDVLKAIDKGSFDLALCAFELSEMPNLQFLLGSNGKANYARYKSGIMDGYLQSAYVAGTADELKSLMSKIQMQVVEDLPILGLFFRSGLMISMESVGGLSGTRQYDALSGLATVTPTK